MNLSRTALLAHARSDAGRRALRYSATSAIAATGTQVILWVFLHPLNMNPIVANLTVVTIMSVPAFMLNKYWVWGKRGRAHMRREVIPFWMFTVAGWILSTIMVIIVVHLTRSASLPHGNKNAAQGANVAGFGVLWVMKYLFLDKIMFGTDHHTPYDEDIEVEELVAGTAPVDS